MIYHSDRDILHLFYFTLFCFSELNLEIPEEKISSIANNASTKLNATLLELRRLFLVENMLDSIKYDNQPFTRSNNEFRISVLQLDVLIVFWEQNQQVIFNSL